MTRVARVSVSLILCLSTLCGNMLFAVAEQTVTPTETYYSEQYETEDIVTSEDQTPAAPVSALLADYCTSMSIALYYTPTGGTKQKINSGDTIPRGSAIELTLTFALKDTVRDECGSNYTFTYTLPTGITLTSVTTPQPCYDGAGKHLFDWWSSSTQIFVQFTEEFYAKVYNNVEGFVTLTGTLSTTNIVDGKATYNFPGESDFIIKFPPATPTVMKSYRTLYFEGSYLVVPYYVRYYAEDNMDKVEFKDVRGDYVNYPMQNIKVLGGMSWTVLDTSHTVIQHEEVDGKYVIEGPSIAQKGYYYFLTYDVYIPIDIVLNGYLASTIAVGSRQNKCTVTVTDKNGNTASAPPAYGTLTYAPTDLVTVSKARNGTTPTDGRTTFDIVVKVNGPVESVTLNETPTDLLFRNAVFTDVTDPANPVIIPLETPPTATEYVIVAPVPGKEYKFTYVCDFPYSEYAQGLLKDSTLAKNVISASVLWEGGTKRDVSASANITSTAVQFYAPTKTATNTAMPIRVSEDGEYLMDFTVTVPATGSAYFPEIYLTDTLGDYMELIPSSISIAANTSSTTATLASYEGNVFKIRLKNSSAYYNGSYAYTVYYTVKLDKDAVLSGKLDSTITDQTVIDARTNKVKLEWKAYAYSGETAETKYEIVYDTPVEPLTISKSNSGLKYLTDGTPYVDFTIAFTAARSVSELTIDDILGDMFEKTAPDGWTPTIKRGSTVYTGTYTAAYDKYVFTDLPAGSYTITYRVMLAKGFNGLTYSQVLADEGARANTVIMTYQGATELETVTASTVVPAYDMDIEKEGVLQTNEDGSLKTTTLDNATGTYAMVDWIITLTTGSTAMNLLGGELMETLLGRQCFAENDTSRVDSFLSISGVTSKATLKSYATNRVGRQSFLQEFTYVLGTMGESTTATTRTYTFTSYVRLPSVETHLVVTNQAIFKHPYWGRYVALAEVEFDWNGGSGGSGIGIGSVALNKELVSLDPVTYADSNPAEIVATWQITIPVSSGQVITDAILTDYMNHWYPDSYFDVDRLGLSVLYQGESTGPAYKAPYVIKNEKGINCLFIEFEETLDRTVVVTLNTFHSDIEAIEKGKRNINFADLEYSYDDDSDASYYSVDKDYWDLQMTGLEKAGQAPRYDETSGKYVIDWMIILDDSLRQGLVTRIEDILPEGLTLLPSTVNTGTGTLTSVTEGTGENAGTFVIHFTPTEKVTQITFSTVIGDAYLDSFQSFINRANVLARDLKSDEVFATASAMVEFDPVRTLTKTGRVVYNEQKDRYEILWTIQLNDETRRNQTIYLNDRLPDGVSYVEGSIATVPSGRLQGTTLAADGKSLMIVLNPANSGEVEIQFLTAIDDAKLTQANQMFAFHNFVDLLASNDAEDVVRTAEGICNLGGGVREFTKIGYAHYDAEEDNFVVDWTIVLDEQARVGRVVTLSETLPDGLTLGEIKMTAGEGGVPVAFEIKNMSVDRKTFDLVYTPSIARTVITIRTYIDANLNSTDTFSERYVNMADLISQDGTHIIDSVQAAVDIDNDVQFTKNVSNDPIAYNEELGKYEIKWELNLHAPLAVGRAIVIEDIVPEGLSLRAANAVTCSDGQEPSPLTYSYEPTTRKLTINVMPAVADMTLILHTTINDDWLFYTTTMPTYHNVATVVTYDLTDDAYAQFGLTPSEVLTKSGVQATGSNQITYTVEVNKLEIDLASGESEIVLEDTLNDCYTMLLDTIKVTDGNGSSLSAQDYRVQYDATTRLLSFHLPNKMYIKLTFTVLLNGTPGETVTVVNSIDLKGVGISVSTKEDTFTVQSAKAGVTYDTDYVKIHKYDSSDTSKNLQGAQFELYLVESDGSATLIDVTTDLTNEKGVLCLPNEKGGIATNRLYYIVEVHAPTDYILDTTPHYFFIPGKDEAVANEALAAIRKEYPDLTILVSRSPQFDMNNWIELKTRIIVRKVIAGTSTLLSGAVLEIWDDLKAEKPLYTFTSGMVATTLENVIPTYDKDKTYWLVEKQPPIGYMYAQPVSFKLTDLTVKQGGEDTIVGYQSVTMEDVKPSLVIDKRDAITKERAAGAQLLLEDSKGIEVAKWSSSATESKVIPNVEVGAVYTLTETTAPGGYYTPATTIIKYLMVDAYGKVHELSGPNATIETGDVGTASYDLLNTPYNIKIIKADKDGGAPLPDAKLQLFKTPMGPDSEPYLEWTSKTDPYVPTKLLPAGKYILHETEAPTGYKLAADIEIEIKNTDEVQTFTIENELDPLTSVKVSKAWSDAGNQDGIRPGSVDVQLYADGDEYGEPVTLTIDDFNDGTWEYTWENLPKWKGRTEIEYTVDEVDVPDGYGMKVTGSDNSYTITNTHVPATITVTVEKVWVGDSDRVDKRLPVLVQLVEDKVPVPGAIKELKADSWKETYSGLPKYKNGKAIVYTIEEIDKPTGYISAVSGIDNSNVIKVTNTLTQVTVKKLRLNSIDGSTVETALTGATLEIWNEDRSEMVLSKAFESVDGGNVFKGVLTGGATYWLVEAKAPAGFVKAEAVQFTVDKSDITVKMYDAPTRVIIRKVNTLGALISGAELRIVDPSNDEVVWSGKTTGNTILVSRDNIALSDITKYEKGVIVLEGILEAGKEYTLEETKAPTGYKLAEPESFIVNDTPTVTTVTMEDEADEGIYEVRIHKVDQFGNYVVGATLRLTDLDLPDGDPDKIREWMTEEGEYYPVMLEASTSTRYQLEEIITPKGYEPFEAFTFYVDKSQVKDLEDGEAIELWVEDTKTSVDISGKKTWNDQGAAGLVHPTVTIELHRSDDPDKVIDTTTTTIENGEETYSFLELPAADDDGNEYTYTVKEVPMDGYVTVQSGYNFRNIATKLIILKVKKTASGDPLVGAELALYDGDEMVGDSWITDGTAKVFIGELIAGKTYTLKEIEAPFGYGKFSDINIEIPREIPTGKTEADIVVTVTAIDPLDDWTKLTIRKVALKAEDGGEALLGGAVLGLYEKDTGKLVGGSTWNTATVNPKEFKGLDPTVTYVLREETAPDGFVKAEDIEISAADNVNKEQTVTMTNLRNTVSISKIAGVSTKVAGAVLEIRSGDTAVRRWVSTGDALRIMGLPAGIYTLHENVPPAGYATNPKAIKFEVKDDGTITVIGEVDNLPRSTATEPIGNPTPEYQTHPNSAGNEVEIRNDLLDIKIRKVDPSGAALSGAELEVYEGNVKGNTSGKTVYFSWTSGAEAYVPESPKLLEANKTYTLHEKKAPNGYRLAEDMVFTVLDTTAEQIITMTDPKTKVLIAKQDTSTDNNYVVGAELTLTETVSGALIDTWTTGSTAKEFVGILTVGKSYTLKETFTPDGYSTAAQMTFAPTEDETYTVVMQDKLINVQISKLDDAGTSYLSGANLALYALDDTGTETYLEEWTTGASAYKPAAKLVENKTYLVREVSAPDGYTLAADTRFTVTPNLDIQVVSIQNKKTEVRFIKVDEVTTQTLAGAKLRVIDPVTKETMASWTSATTAHVIYGLVAGKEYMLIEDSAPSGYGVANSLYFTVPEDQRTLTVTMEDPHLYLFIKIDVFTGKTLPGATLYIQDTLGNIVVPQWTSTNKAHQVVGTLEPGKTYKLVESSAPAGYNKADPVTFTVGADGKLTTIVMGDATVPPPTPTPPLTTSVSVTKRWQDYNNAGGIRPSSITLNLYQKLATASAYPSSPYLTVSVTGTGNTWTFTFNSLPRVSGGVLYDYLVTEDPVTGYEVQYANNGQTITNYIPGNPYDPTPTPFATPTPAAGTTLASARIPVGVQYVDGEWVYIDENQVPLGVVPLTGDDTNWLVWAAAVLIPILVAVFAVLELRRRKKRQA